jgi:hypothetical protein
MRDYIVRVVLTEFGERVTRDTVIRERTKTDAKAAARQAGYRSILAAWRAEETVR